MTHIEINECPDGDWLQKAQAVTLALIDAANDAERKKIIDKNAHIWSELRDWLRSFTGNQPKCWFSECPIGDDSLVVEHFRPKKQLIHLNNRNEWKNRESLKEYQDVSSKLPDLQQSQSIGYWYLAFDWRNYAFSADKPNTSKGSFFPLMPGSTAALEFGASLTNEFPALINPRVKEDVELLGAFSDGFITPINDGHWERYRALVSIELYDLNNIFFRNARETLWGVLKSKVKLLDKNHRKKIEKVKKLQSQTLPPNDLTELNEDILLLEQNIQALQKELILAVSISAPYTATARACLKTLEAGGYAWLGRILSAV